MTGVMYCLLCFWGSSSCAGPHSLRLTRYVRSLHCWGNGPGAAAAAAAAGAAVSVLGRVTVGFITNIQVELTLQPTQRPMRVLVAAVVAAVLVVTWSCTWWWSVRCGKAAGPFAGAVLEVQEQ